MADPRLKTYGAAALVFALDRVTKSIVEARVGFFDTYKVIPGFFDIVHSQNRGVAFGLFNDSPVEWRTLALGLVSLAAVIAVAAMLFYIGDWHWPTFNVADSAITIGSCLLVVELLRPKRQAAGA
jgi:signal peptidase II